MCLAIPAKIVSEPNEIQMAEVDILGVKRHVSLMMTPSAVEGDYVLVHAGFAIQVIDEQFANESLEMLSQVGIKSVAELEAEELGGAELDPTDSEAASSGVTA